MGGPGKIAFYPHYLGNIMLSFTYIVLKISPLTCTSLFKECILEWREWEILMFLGCVIVLKNRKQPSIRQYLSTAFQFSKVANLVLFFRQNPLMSVLYGVLCLVHAIILPAPAYSGPNLITYFRGEDLQEEIDRDKRVTWFVEFYAAWSPACIQFGPVYAELSANYNLENLKFGKIDASRYNDVAKRYNVNNSSLSKELPTVIMFVNGKEKDRRPVLENGKITKYIWTQENFVKSFHLNEVYSQCKQNPIKKRDRGDGSNKQKSE